MSNSSWTDNLDKELKAQRRIKKENQNQTNCNTSKSKAMRNVKKSKIPILKKPPATQISTVESITIAKSITEEEEKEKKETVKEAKSAIALFADRVTMAGIDDLYKAKTKWERWMWYFTLVFALTSTVLAARNIALKYIYSQSVYDYYPIVNFQPPFPNVSICAPLVFNETKFLQYLRIPNRTRNLIRRKNLDLQMIIDFTMEFWRYDQYPRIINDQNKLIAHASFEIMKASVVQFSKGFMGLAFETQPSCHEILSNCYFGGIPFDCCQAAARVFLYDMICYQITVARIPMFADSAPAKGGETDDPIKLETSGLVVEANFDWEMASYYEETAKDGFHLVVGGMVAASASPVAVPSGADALVTIGATKREDLTSCRPNNRLPKMKYFDYYDADGLFHYTELNNVQMLIDRLGCDVPTLTHDIANDSTLPPCPIESAVYLKTFANNGDEDIKLLSSSTIKPTELAQFENAAFGSSLPLCDRWEYKISTASYGYVHYRNQTEWDRRREDKGKAWSRIRFFFPSSSYLYRVEQAAAMPYVAMCDVGGSMGVYIGVSLISFVQLFVYGVFVCYSVVAKYFKRRLVCCREIY